MCIKQTLFNIRNSFGAENKGTAIKMKFFVAVFVSVVIALSVAGPLNGDIQALFQLTNDIDRVLPGIAIEVAEALNGESNDLVNGNSRFVKKFEDIIGKLHPIKKNLPDDLQPFAENVFSELNQLHELLQMGIFSHADRIIESAFKYNAELRAKINHEM